MHANSARVLRGPQWDDHGNVSHQGEPGLMVGGERDTSGKRIETKHVNAPLSLLDAHHSWITTQILTGGRSQTHLGSWRNEEGEVELDAVGKYGPKTGMKKMVDRNEKALFNHKTGETVNNDHYDPNRPRT